MSTEKWTDYACEYGYDGKQWAFSIRATSWDDARARVKAMGTGRVVGSDLTVIPVPRGLGWLAKRWALWLGEPRP
jgi:hypothetical protein